MNDITRKMINDAVSDIHTSLPAKINKYDAEKMRAEITLISKQNLEGEMVEIPPVLEVPVGFMKAGKFIIRLPFQKGDVVVVVFSEKAIDQLLISGKSEEVKYTRMHSIDDAIIVNSLQLESESDLNSSYTSDLLIENQEANSRIVMKNNGDLLAETSGNTTIDTSGSTTVNSGAPVTVNAPNTTVNGTVDLAGGGPPVARVGDAIETYVSGGSSAGTHVGVITAGSESVTSG
jgi:hypothetical protein